ncbi:Tetratricopeptide domain protein (fragment) [Methylorubrum extorquens]|uniref:Tetratricopeptide domain protein n=1 Tax=Methylorubrum extorquens TaxID=408 RepID=A0A2N9AYN3_METEX
MGRIPLVRLQPVLLAGALLVGSGTTRAETGSVEATCGSVAIGGTALGNTIKINGTVVCGIPPEKLEGLIQGLIQNKTRDVQELSEARKQTIGLLEKELDLNQRQVRAALEIVGEANVPPEGLAAKLVQVAEQFKALQTNAAAQPGDDPQVTALKADAQKAINAFDLGQADELLAKVQTAQDVAADRLALKAAETAAQRGRLALTRLRYDEAALHFAAAAVRLPSGQDNKRLEYREAEASALYQRGDERGDNAALRKSAEVYRTILQEYTRDRVPLDWARIQHNLGSALWSLGERESGTERLRQAAAAYNAALQELTRERVPLDWAAAQDNLGSALQVGSSIRMIWSLISWRLSLFSAERPRPALCAKVWQGHPARLTGTTSQHCLSL